MMATGQIASIALLTIPAILLLAQKSAAQRPTGQSSPSLIVTPSTSIAFFGPQGGPFSPSFTEYRVSASTGTVSYSIRTLSWLTAVRRPSLTRPTDQIERGRGGYLLDDHGGYLMDPRGNRLLAQ